MSVVSLRLLGPPSVTLPGGAEGGVATAKGLSLLAYLALEPGIHRREELATLLWGESPENAARASLRQVLRRVRVAVGDVMRTDAQTVELVGPVQCDVTAFLQAVDRDPRAAAEYEVPRFFEGLTPRAAPAFEDWVATKRQTLARRYVEVLRRLVRDAFAASHWREAAGWADRWLACEPLSDEGTRLAVEASYLAGDRAVALARLAAYRRRLAEETGSKPSAALEALTERIAQEVRVRQPVADPYDESPPEPDFECELVGREEAWHRLSELWAAVMRGGGRVVLLEGEAGLGKTRLAEEFVRWAAVEGGTAARGRCFEGQQDMSYGPLLDALRDILEAPGAAGAAPEWLSEIARLLPEVRTRFPGLPAAPEPGGMAERRRLFEAMAQVVAAVTTERPTVLYLDDIQFADGETCTFVEFLSRRLSSLPVLLLATSTLGEIERASAAARLCRGLRALPEAVVVTLKPLTEEELWRMVRALGRLRAPEGGRRLAERLHAATDGNPFHAIEVLKELFGRGLLGTRAETGEWVAMPAPEGQSYADVELPRTVHDAVARRVARLPYELRDLLATLAVAGRDVRTDLLSHVHGMSRLRVAALADALVERRLAAEEDGGYRCAHPVITDVVRDGLTPARRRELHRAIALSLGIVVPEGDRDRWAGEIARHAVRGGERALAWRAALAAGEAAVDRYAFDEASAWLDLAGEVTGTDTERDELARRAADLMARAGWSERPPGARTRSSTRRRLERHDLDLDKPSVG